MKIKVTRPNAKGLTVASDGVTAYEHVHGRPLTSDPTTKRGGWIGITSTVYAVHVSAFHAFYYIRNPKLPGMAFIPAQCCRILDARMSRHWHAEHRLSRFNGKPDALPALHPIATFAIRDWIEDADFLPRFAAGGAREIAIMDTAVAEMDAEFG